MKDLLELFKEYNKQAIGNLNQITIMDDGSGVVENIILEIEYFEFSNIEELIQGLKNFRDDQVL